MGVVCESLRDFCMGVTRKKPLPSASGAELYETPLRRSLTTFHLTLMGMGAMFGSGLYVLTGIEAKNVVGPAVVVSYAIAAFASTFSAMCYVEFACRVPRTGSAYTFTYIAVGEIWAFIIGWDLILEYSILCAAVSRAFTGYVDSLADKALSNFTINTIMKGHTWTNPYLAPYPDIFAATLVILLTLFIMTGAKVSSFINNVFLAINCTVIVIIIIVGFQKANIKNWTGEGGFVPYGAGSVFAAAAKLFFSYIGFDIIAIANEETVDPKRSVPRAMFLAIFITTTVYMLTSVVLTLMVPYYQLDESSAFAAALAVRGVEWARWVVGIGALCAMFCAVLMGLYCLPRSIYAIGSDGLLFKFLAKVNGVTKVPIYATIFGLILVVIPTIFFTVAQLVEFLSIGVLLGYTFVATAVLILRYKSEDTVHLERGTIELESPTSSRTDATKEDSKESTDSDCSRLLDTNSTLPGTLQDRYRSVPLLRELARFPPGRAVNACLVLFVCLVFSNVALIEHGYQYIDAVEWWAILLLVLLVIGALITFLLIAVHQQNADPGHYFRVSIASV